MSPETQNSINFFQTIAISTIIILLWLVPEIAGIYPEKGSGSGILGYAPIIALIVTIIAPLVYGWYSRDGNGAILIGTIPFLVMFGFIRVITGNGSVGPGYLDCSVVYLAALIILGGLEGFFAAKKTRGYLLIALLLAVLWAGIFFSGIH
ncbi:MAG: hypothetical protein LUQ31_06085 [Methanoregula sp.]|nr:hypothetical protein [Methanoregula sp.]